MERPRKLICSCCGRYAGQYMQWHNRDRGYGVCTSCISWMKNRNVSDDEISHNYGVAGVNYQQS
jgi:hypothetical protein